MEKYEFLYKELEELRSESLFRSPKCITAIHNTHIRTDERSGSEKICFCSNNYLGLAGDGRLIEAAAKALRRYGVGSGASRLISGTLKPHRDLEEAFAAWVGKERALYFPSGWMANQALLTTLPGRGDLVMSDRLNHASIIDALQAGAADFRTWRRSQPERLGKYLEDSRYRSRFIVTETIFSMDGDCADLPSLVKMKKRHDAILIVDEAHGLGCFGATGAGWSQEQGLLDEVDIVVAPLGKAAASSGALVAGPAVVIDYLVNRARPFIYTTAPLPACAAAALAAIRIIQDEPDRRARLRENADYLRSRLNAMGLNTGKSVSQIIPVIIGDSEKTVRVAEGLEHDGFFIPAVRPPTVPAGTARLRVSVQSGHTREEMDRLCEALGKRLSVSE